MIRALVLSLLVVPGLALAQGMTIPGGDRSAVNLPFRGSSCIGSGNRVGSGRTGAVVTAARTNAITYMNGGVLTGCSANSLSVGPQGAEVWGPFANLAAASTNLAAANWVSTGTCNVVVDQGIFVDGTVSMDALACNGTTDSKGQAVTVASSTGPWTVSGWIASTNATTKVGSLGMTMGTGSATGCTCTRDDGGACTASTSGVNGFAYASVGSTPVRLTASCSTTVAATTVTPLVHDGQFGSTAGVNILAGGFQFQTGGYATPYLATPGTGAAANSVGATVASVNLAAAGVNLAVSNRWCVGVTATPSWPWNSKSQAFILDSRAASTANSFNIQTDATYLYFIVYDSVSGLKQAYGAHGLSTTRSTIRVVACNDAGTLSVYQDGVKKTLSSGAGLGTQTATPNPLQIGASNGTLQFDGSIRDLRIYNGQTYKSGM